MSTLATYATPDDIRALLGVADNELEDVAINGPIFLTQMQEELYLLSPTLEADYATIKAIGSPTAAQTRFLGLVSAYASYSMAGILLGALPMFAPQVIKAEKDEFDRISDPYSALRESIGKVLAVFAKRIDTLYPSLFPSYVQVGNVPLLQVISVGLGTDPVTGV